MTFSDTSGTTRDNDGNITQIDAKTVQSEINTELRHLLFVVASDGQVTVYTPGSTTPIVAQVTQNSNGTTEIDYTQTTNSEDGSTTLTFASILFNDQLSANYEQDFSPVITSTTAPSNVSLEVGGWRIGQ